LIFGRLKAPHNMFMTLSVYFSSVIVVF